MLQPTKHKLLEEISKSGYENQGYILRKVKLSDETRSKLAYQKVQHDLN